jgi:outer membrane receptor protein involved in Fe transport
VLYPTSDVDDWVPKVSLKYQINDDWMVYGLYSEGFRPGGSNRGRGIPYFPRLFDSDTLENIEFGVKSTMANGKLRMNATYFDMSWKDYQLELVDPSYTPCGEEDSLPEPNCGQPWQKVVANVGDASSSGFELQVDAVLTERMTFGFNATWLDAKIDHVDDIVSDIVINGSRLPLSPEFKGSVYAMYEWPVDLLGASKAWVRFQSSYVGDMLNQVEVGEYVPFEVPAPQLVQPSYTISDLKFGLNGDDWSVQLFVNNLSDERAILYDNSNEFDRYWGRGRQTVNRPREYGIRYIKSFGK